MCKRDHPKNFIKIQIPGSLIQRFLTQDLYNEAQESTFQPATNFLDTEQAVKFSGPRAGGPCN